MCRCLLKSLVIWGCRPGDICSFEAVRGSLRWDWNWDGTAV